MGHIFVSYARRDTGFVENMREELLKHDFEAWTDSVLSPGSDWRQEIDEAIRGAFALVVVVTPESKTSEYVTYEWAFALGIGIRVVPLILKPTQLHPRLEFLQHVDFVNYEGDEYP
ncbi:MAG: toll/interleukin-1 receptor domain-containing protein, partial [Anaerolineae bacterium]|nr:toll/interleukin-1 receptor domain-containing protein [Anaerolineae bacterium]